MICGLLFPNSHSHASKVLEEYPLRMQILISFGFEGRADRS